MSLPYVCYKSEQKTLKKKINGTWWLIGFGGGGEGGETTKDNSQVSDLHNCWGSDAFHWDQKKHFQGKNIN